MYRSSRINKGLSIEEAAFRLNISTRCLYNYEKNLREVPPEVVQAMSEVYNDPTILIKQCNKCAIGKNRNFIVLDNVDTSLPAMLLSLDQELNEAQQARVLLKKVSLNKRKAEDFTAHDLRQFKQSLLELIDVAHNIETILIGTSHIIDTSALVSEHNEKCIKRGYSKKYFKTKNRPSYVVAGGQ